MTSEGGSPGRVLVVDTDGPARGSLCEALRAAGIDSTAVETAAGCLEAVRSDRFDAVVAEAELRDSTGLELLRRLREQHPFLPFVVYTDAGSESLAGEAFAAGASGYVPKEDGPSTVADRVRELLLGDGPGVANEGERRYRQLIETSPAPVNLFDADGVVIWGNDAVLDLLGLESRDRLVGRSIFEFVHPSDRPVAERELREVVEERSVLGPTRMDLIRDDGTIRNILVSTAPGRFQGKPIGQAIIVDVTPFRRTREALDAQRRVVANALDTIPDVFVFLDTEGQLRRWNAAAAETTGYSEGALDDLSVTDLILDEDVDRVLESFETVLAEGSDVVEARIVTVDGEHIPHEFRGSRLDDPDGNPLGVVGIARDVSDLRERERQLVVLAHMLRHNVRNNVNVIVGYADAIGRGRVDDVGTAAEKIRTHGERLVEQAEKEKRLVDMVTGADVRTRIDIVDLLEGVVETVRGRHPEASIELTPTDEPQVRAVSGLDLALEELLENATSHSDLDEPTVRIEVSETAGECRVRIADDGPGIPEIERTVLSSDEPMDQLHHGSGVGLWLVHWAVRLSDGSVTFERQEPRGTVVSLTLQTAGTE